MAYKYREALLDEFSRHGVIPNGDTPPELIHEFVSALYLYEIRALRRRLLAGAVEKADYASHVASLRNRYPILSIPIRLWVEPD